MKSPTETETAYSQDHLPFCHTYGLVCKVLCKLLKKDHNIHNDSYITKVNNSLEVVSKGFLEADTIENDTKQISLPATNDNSWLIITSQGLFTRRNLP